MADPNSVSLAAIGLAATAIGSVVYTVRYLLNTLSKDLREHTEAATKLAAAAEQQTKASGEVLIFMKNLNGKLSKATIATAKENKE